MHVDGRGAQEEIRRRARRVGFELCGFATLPSAPPHAAFLQQWLEHGNAGGMAYIERGLTKRLDPRAILPEACSVISVGYRYQPPPLPPVDWREQLRGRIAAYALGTDYHRVVEAKLRELGKGVEEFCTGAVTRAYVDTGAILEREWAATGGLGWFGKNTNILHTAEGSYFFLGELLTNLEFESDPPIPDHCGTCTRCLDLCPTAALKPGYELDARLCISYLTIEHRGAIPVELRVKMGNWILGCDICQEVCPWNEKLVRRDGTPDTEQLLPSLPGLMALDEAQFRDRFRDSAVRRAKRDCLLRNVAVALGNTRNPAAVAPLRSALQGDPSPLVRAHAAWALGMIGDGAARQVLDHQRRLDPVEAVRGEIEAALLGAVT